jgi:hypothetical protein
MRQPCTQNWHQTGNFVTLRKQKNKEMKRLKRVSVLTGCRRDCLTVEEGAWIQGSLAGSSSCATRDPDPCPQIACMRKHQSRGWNGSNRVGGNYNGS